MTNRMITKAVAAAALMAAAQTASSAVVLTAVETESFSGIPTYNQSSSGQAPLTFDKFDSGLGTLLNVYVRANVGVTGGNVFVDNDGVDAATGNAELGAELDIGSGDVNLLDAAFQAIGTGVTASNSYAFNLAGDDGDGSGVDATGPDGASQAGIAANASDGFTAVNNTFLSQFIGTGATFDVNYNVSQIFQLAFTGGVAGGFDPVNSTGSVEIYYEYDDGNNGGSVPNPAPLALLGLGLLAMRRKLSA